MMYSFLNIIVGSMLIIGSIFSLVAAVGLIRFPDVYGRMHAASKAGTLGAGLLLLAIALHSLELSVATRAVAGFIFLLLTAPISAHLLARASYFAGYKTWSGTRIDHLSGKYRIDGDHISCSGMELD